MCVCVLACISVRVLCKCALYVKNDEWSLWFLMAWMPCYTVDCYGDQSAASSTAPVVKSYRSFFKQSHKDSPA